MLHVIHRIREQFLNLTRHWFVRDVVTLQIGSFAGTLVQAIAGVALARLLQPELFGLYTLAFSMASVASIVLSSGAQDAVTTIAGEAHARKDATTLKNSLAFLIKYGLSAGAVASVLALLAPWIADMLYGNRIIGLYAEVLILASIISTLLYSVTLVALQVSGMISRLAFLTLMDSLVRYLCSILLFVVGFGVLGAVMGHMVGAIVVALFAALSWRTIVRTDSLFPRLRSLIIQVSRVSLRRHLGFSYKTTTLQHLKHRRQTPLDTPASNKKINSTQTLYK